MAHRRRTHLFVRREYSKACTCGLVLIRSAQCPESYRSSTKLSEPAFEFRLRGVVGESTHVEDFAPLCQECPHIRIGVHWTRQDVWVFRGRLRFTNQTAKYSSQRDRLLHSTPWGCRRQSLKVERQVVLDGRRRLDGFHLECRADVCKRA